jgi:hypothetical protein
MERSPLRTSCAATFRGRHSPVSDRVLSDTWGSADVVAVSDDRGDRRLHEGYRLHMRGGRSAAAERAYREAIAAGRVDAWLNLGVLLQPRHGREHDAKEAFRMAMAGEDPAVSSRAAVELGGMLDKLDGDIAGARECYAFAAEYGSGVVWENATVNYAFILGAEGDREGAISGYQSVLARRFRVAGLDAPRDDGRRISACFVGLARRARPRRLLRRVAVSAYRGRRLRRRLLPGGLGARLRP